MSNTRPEPQSFSIAESVHAACGRFQAECKAGRTPRIEDYLAGAADAARPSLLRSLLQVEMQISLRQGRTPSADEYCRRFPEHRELVGEVLRKAIETSLRTHPTAAPDRTGQAPTARTVSFREPSVDTSEGNTLSLPVAEHPKTVGRFQVLDVLGEGGFGVVYRARDSQLEREVAIKVPRKEMLATAGDQQRFLREARAAATLNHPNICPVYEAGEIDGRHCIVMAYIDGKPLSKIIKSGQGLPERQAANAVRKLALALHEAHLQGVVHRDLKPANVIVNRRGEPVIMDFGLARRTNSSDARITQSGMVIGTPAYMSPEQARGESADVGPETDVYSLGVILYELLTGRRPFEGTITVVLGQILHVEPKRPAELRPGLDSRLEMICLKAMAKEPTLRYASMREFAAALADYLRQGSESPQPAAPLEQAVQEAMAAEAFPGAAFPAEALPAVQSLPSGADTRQFAALLAGMKTEIRRAARRQRIPWWAWLLIAAIPALLFAGILLFARTPTSTVLINIDVDIHDPQLTFKLDGQPIAGESLEKAIELTVGEHTLDVFQNEALFRRYRLNVAKGAEAAVVVKEETVSPDGAPPDDSQGWVSLFDGHGFTGWEGLLDHWSVRDGAIVGKLPTNRTGGYTYLCTQRPYRDFELRFKARLLSGNSGVQFRSFVTSRDTFDVAGPQVEVNEGKLLCSGSLVTAPSGKPEVQAPFEAVRSILRRDDFDDYYVKAVGSHVTIKVNGLTTVDQEFTMPPEGIIGLQLHRWHPGMEVMFKEIEIRELEPTVPVGFVELFNGRDLSGWTKRNGGPAAWKVQDGALEVVVGQGDIMTQRSFGPNFELHVEFWVPRMSNRTGQGRGNSGVYLQGRHEIQILDSSWNGEANRGCGALYGVIAPKPGGLRGAEEWQSFDIVFHAPSVDASGNVLAKGRVTVVHNGVTVIEEGEFNAVVGLALDNRLGAPGPILLQDHGAAVRFRNLRIKELPASNDAGWKPLFPADDLSAWEGLMEFWDLRNGTLVGRPTSRQYNTCLCSKRRYRDFEIRCQVKLSNGANSGLQVRSELDLPDKFIVRGPQCDMGAAAWGGVWGERVKNGWLLPAAAQAVSKALKPNDFNDYYVRCVGRRVTIKINGETTADGEIVQMAADGILAFQLHSNNTGEVVFRNIEIKEL